MSLLPLPLSFFLFLYFLLFYGHYTIVVRWTDRGDSRENVDAKQQCERAPNIQISSRKPFLSHSEKGMSEKSFPFVLVLASLVGHVALRSMSMSRRGAHADDTSLSLTCIISRAVSLIASCLIFKEL